ncbi:MAG: hypothetical protein IH988_03455 [Planctomycetes bacterium]|nr:hypothetical protein [Planctomycetota bacterium]
MSAWNPVRRLLGLGGALSLAILVWVGGCGASGGADPPANENEGVADTPTETTLRCIPQAGAGTSSVSYSQDILPILAQGGCLSSGCHGGDNVSSDYSLDTYEGLFGPGKQAGVLGICNVVAGDPEACYLLHKLNVDIPLIGVRMPNTGLWLSDEHYQLLQTWIVDGAPNN